MKKMFSPMMVVWRSGPEGLPLSSPNLASALTFRGPQDRGRAVVLRFQVIMGEPLPLGVLRTPRRYSLGPLLPLRNGMRHHRSLHLATNTTGDLDLAVLLVQLPRNNSGDSISPSRLSRGRKLDYKSALALTTFKRPSRARTPPLPNSRLSSSSAQSDFSLASVYDPDRCTHGFVAVIVAILYMLNERVECGSSFVETRWQNREAGLI